MHTAGLFIFPWDFADEEIESVLDRVCYLGITRLYLASVYHAGYFLHPHNTKRRVQMLEDGVTYFHCDQFRYTSTPLKPKVANLCAQTDWFALICEEARRRGLEVCAWTVCCHNTRLGLLHPQCTVQNVFGDSYPHALSPGHPAVREYLRALVTDLATNYPLYSIFLEAPDYRGRRHGHHHERHGVHLGPLEDRLMDLSFNPQDMAGAQAAGIDVETLRSAVRRHLEQYFVAAPLAAPGLPHTIEEFRETVPALAEYEAYLQNAEESLRAELRAVVSPRGVKLEGVGDSPSWNVVLTGAYGEPPTRVAELTSQARARLRPGQQLVVLIRIGFNGPDMGTSIESEAATCDVTRAVADNGADGIAFYNYSEAPIQSVEWIKPALQEVRPGSNTQ